MKKAKDPPESEPAELASLVGERIRKIRKEEGLSLELFALRCDMNAAYVGHIERGVQNPTLNTLERICKGLDIRVEDLFIDTVFPIHAAASPPILVDGGRCSSLLKKRAANIPF